jgi:hypothetical protein
MGSKYSKTALRIAGAGTASVPVAGGISIKERLHRVREIARCKEDPVYFISNYLKIFEPRQQGFIPFKLWGYQVAYIRKLEAKLALAKETNLPQTVVVKKCRDMGATLVTESDEFWHWWADENYTCLVGSLRAEEVKKTEGEYDPLLSKIDGFLKSLPAWMWPEGFDYEEDSQAMLLRNRAQNNTIVGSSMSENFGLSKRKTVVHLDEYSQLPWAVAGQCRQTTNLLVLTSTVNGEGPFEEECQKAEAAGDLVEMPWNLNPNHTQAWFDKQQQDLTRAEFARFILMDPKASMEGLVYEKFLKVRITEAADYDPSRMLCTSWDFGLVNQTVILFISYDYITGSVDIIDEVVATHQDILFFIPFVPGASPVRPNPFSYTEAQEAQIEIHKGWKRPIRNFGDRSGDAQAQGMLETSWRTLSNHRITMMLNDTFYQDMSERVKITRRGLDRVRVNPRCKQFIKALRNAHYQKIKQNSQSTSHKDPQPVHDWTSDARTALEYFFISENLIPREEYFWDEPEPAGAYAGAFPGQRGPGGRKKSLDDIADPWAMD